MLTVNSTYGSFHIPDGAEFCIYLCNQETMRYTAADTGKEDIYEYGDVVFETSHMKYIFREMRDPFGFYIAHLADLDLSGNRTLYIDAFDPDYLYCTLEVQAKDSPSACFGRQKNVCRRYEAAQFLKDTARQQSPTAWRVFWKNSFDNLGKCTI